MQEQQTSNGGGNERVVPGASGASGGGVAPPVNGGGNGSVPGHAGNGAAVNGQQQSNQQQTNGQQAPSGSSFLDGDEGDERQIQEANRNAGGQWREDWREALSKGDDKFLNELKRYNSFDAWATAQRALRQRMSSGEFKRAKLPDNATEEQKAQWRQENNIPPEPTAYEVPELPNREWSEADEPILESLFTTLHGANVSQDTMDTLLNWYGQFEQQKQLEALQSDQEDRQRSQDERRSEWGIEFRPNVNLINRYLSDNSRVPEGFGDLLKGARGPDGRLLLNKPGVADWLLTLAKGAYGDGAIIYGEERTNVTSRLEEIDKIMNTDYDRYMREGLDKVRLELVRKMEKAGVKYGQ